MKKVFLLAWFCLQSLSALAQRTPYQWVTPPRQWCDLYGGGIGAQLNDLTCAYPLAKTTVAGDPQAISWVNNSDTASVTPRTLLSVATCSALTGANTGTVTVSGTAVTYVSGNNFSNLITGLAIDLDGTWRVITAVNSNTSLTVNQSAPSGSYSTNGYCASSLDTWIIQGTGTVNTSGTAVTWVSGGKFFASWAGETILINGVSYTIATVNSSTSITLTTSAGTQSGVAYSLVGYGQVASGGTTSAGVATSIAVGGANYYSFTRSQNNQNETQSASFTELTPPAGTTPFVDSANLLGINVSSLSQTLTPATVTGTDDIVQGASTGDPDAGQGPWTYDFTAHFAYYYLLGTASGAPPTLTNTQSWSAAGSSVAWGYNGGGGGPQTPLTINGGVKFNGGILFNSPVSTLAITSTSPLPPCTDGVPFSYTFNATGGQSPYTWTQPSGTLQPGLSLSSAGVLSGTCTNSSGTETFGIKVCDSETPAACAVGTFQQTANNSLGTLVVCDSSSSPSCANPPTPLVTGSYYSYTFNAGGGTAPYSWQVASGSIPPGMTLTSAGFLSGFPATAATYTYTVQVTDSSTPTPETATASFTEVVNGANGAPQIAAEPQNWVTLYQGGVNATTGNPCQPTDTNCTNNLPKTCNAANHCIHEQLGFGSNDHPATLAGLTAAGCDWASNLDSWILSHYSTNSQGWYLWVEVANGTLLSSGSLDSTNNAMWNAPVKIQGWTSVGSSTTGTCPISPAVTPIGVWSIAGTITGNFQLGEVIKQQTSGAEANLEFYGCAATSGGPIDVPPVYPRPCVNGVVTGATGVYQTGPIQVGPIVNGVDTDATDDWIGQTSGAILAPSAAPVANGYFRLTGQCSPGAGSGSPLTAGYPVGSNDTPCNNLTNQIPCFHSLLDSAIVNVSPTGANSNNCYNDLPSMFTFALASWTRSPSPVVIEQMGNNTSLSGFEVTLTPGIDQEMSSSGPCAPYSVNCSGSPELIDVDCISCIRDHYFAHGWDPGDPAPYGGWGLSQEQIGINAGYPVNPTDGHHECPTWSYYSTAPASTGNPPITLTGPNLPYDSGCGEKLELGVGIRSGGFTADEYFAVSKTHEFQDETHAYIIGHGADNLNPLPGNVVPGQVNTGGNGMQGPHKLAHFILRGTSESFFTGGSAINPNNGVLTDLEVRDFRTGSDPGYRFLTGGTGHSPQASVPQVPNSQGYGCGQPANMQGSGFAQICPFEWAMKKGLELKYCSRCMIDGFIAEYTWPDAQTGEIFAMDARVCSGGTVCSIVDQNGVPLTQSNDIRWTNGIARNASGMWSISPRSLGPGNGGGVSQGENRNLLYNLLVYNLDNQEFGGSNGGDAVLYGSAGNTYPNCTASVSAGIESVTCPNPPYNATGLTGISAATTGPPTNETVTVNFVGRQDVLNGGTAQFSEVACGSGTEPPCLPAPYPAIIAAGIDCRTLPCTTSGVAPGFYAPTCNAGIYSNSAQIGSACSNCGSGGASQCPAFGTTTVGSNSPYGNAAICSGEGNDAGECGPANLSIQSVAFNLLDISPGDIVEVSNCTPGTFNTPAEPAVPNTYAINTQNPASLTVSFPAPSGLSGTATNCQVNNAPSFQRNFIINHLSLFTGGQARLTATAHGYTPQMLQNEMINSMFYFGSNGNGIFCSSGSCNNTEANKGPYKTWDQQSNQIHHDVFVLPTTARAALYSAVGFTGSPFCPSSAGLNGGGNCVPATVGCATSQTIDGNGNPTCVGLTGFLTGTTSFPSSDCTQSNGINTCPLVSPPWGTFDYHNLQLCASCYLGVANFFTEYASDGFPVGACIGYSPYCTHLGSQAFVAIDTALTRTEYSCYGSCGLGPWPD